MNEQLSNLVVANLFPKRAKFFYQKPSEGQNTYNKTWWAST
jgi:hypothetical protein